MGVNLIAIVANEVYSQTGAATTSGLEEMINGLYGVAEATGLTLEDIAYFNRLHTFIVGAEEPEHAMFDWGEVEFQGTLTQALEVYGNEDTVPHFAVTPHLSIVEYGPEGFELFKAFMATWDENKYRAVVMRVRG